MAIAMLCAVPVSLCAQAKPKRDVRKDVVSTQKPHGIKKKQFPSKRNNKITRKTRRASSRLFSKKDEEYLTVYYTNDPSLQISLNSVHIEHGKEFMTLSVQFDIKNAIGKACFVECRLMDADGRYVCYNSGDKIIRYSDDVVTPHSYNQNISSSIHLTNNYIPVGKEEKEFVWMIMAWCDNHYLCTTYKGFFAKKGRMNVETRD